MKKIKNISLSIISVFVFIFSAIFFAGCKEENDICRLFVFATVGGYVQVNNNEDYIKFGDEGSKRFDFNEDEKITLKAVAEAGYDFVKWEYTEDFDEVNENFEYQPEISFIIDDDEVVIRAVFAPNGSISYTVSYPTNTTGYTIVPEDGYSSTVELGGNFKFKINLEEDYSNSDIVVKVGNTIYNPDVNGVYTISNITRDINILVEGVEINTPEQPEPAKTYTISTQDNRFTMIPVGTSGFEVEEGSSFTFRIELKSGYKYGSNVVVKVNGTPITPVSNQYTIISVIENVEITVEGIEVDTPVTPDPVETYTISTQDNRFTMIPVGTSGFEVEEGSSFTFRIELKSGYVYDGIVVKANGVIVNPVNNQYTITNITRDIVITVEGIVEEYYIMTLPLSDEYEYTILHSDGKDVYGNPIVLRHNQFEFKLTNIKDSLTIDRIIVKGNGVELPPVKDGIYSISVDSDIDFTIEIYRNYTLKFEDDDFNDLLGGLLLDIPETISFTIDKEDRTSSIYEIDKFMINTSFGETISILELIENINNIISNYGYNFSNSSHFDINGETFISINDNIMTINWNLLNNVQSGYEISIVL